MKKLGVIKRVVCRMLMSPTKYAKHIGITIGKNSWINTKNFSTEPYLITIGDNVRLAKNVTLYTHGGLYGLRRIFNDPTLDYFGKVTIGNNVYVGEDAKILPGVSIEDNCIIAAGTIVSKSVKRGSVVGGNPMQYLGTVEQAYTRLKKISQPTMGMSSSEKKDFLMNLDQDGFKNAPYLKVK